jgi:hypothetical protein
LVNGDTSQVIRENYQVRWAWIVIVFIDFVAIFFISKNGIHHDTCGVNNLSDNRNGSQNTSSRIHHSSLSTANSIPMTYIHKNPFLMLFYNLIFSLLNDRLPKGFLNKIFSYIFLHLRHIPPWCDCTHSNLHRFFLHNILHSLLLIPLN